MTIEKKSSASIEKAADCLASGRIAILPTDTVYGFSGIVDVKGKERRSCDEAIRRIKGREEGKPFISLIASPEEIYNYTADEIPPALLGLWPGPLTLIVRAKAESPLDMPLKTVAFRCPGDGWLRRVIALAGGPIYSSSVNRSGRVALVVDDGDRDGSLPSTIVSVSGGTPRIVRQGALAVPGL